MEAENNSTNEAQGAGCRCRKVPWMWIALAAAVMLLGGIVLIVGRLAHWDVFGSRHRASDEKAEQENRERAEREARERLEKAIPALIAGMVQIPDKDYRMGRTEVTQAQWEAVMGNNPSHFKGADNPVENVSFDDCREFLKKLNALPAVKESGFVFRLPTEEEWKFACRTGVTGGEHYCRLADGTKITERNLGEMAWSKENSGSKTHPVGQQKPNAFGLYDMYGNVWEWVSPADGKSRAYCGGSWYESARSCNFTSRGMFKPDHRRNFLGFRLCASNERETREKMAKAVSAIISGMVQVPGKGYKMGKTEVTQIQWKAVMGEKSCAFMGADNPVENVSWNDCHEFLEKLNALPAVKESGLVFRLPTEKEWEFACRAGATGDYCKLADGTEITRKSLGEVAWYGGNSGGKTHPVGQKKPNAFGLHDMHGNVSEWCEDLYKDGESCRVGRGGSFFSDSWVCTVGGRSSGSPDDRYMTHGFRLAASQDVNREGRAPARPHAPREGPVPRFEATTRLLFNPKKMPKIENLTEQQLLSILDRPSLKQKIAELVEMSAEERQSLSKDVTLAQERHPPNLFTLTVASRTENGAAQKANAYAEILVEEYVTYRTTDLENRHTAITSRRKTLLDQLAAIEAEEKTLKTKTGGVSPQESLLTLNTLISAQRRNLSALDVDIANENVKRSRLEKEVGASGPAIIANAAAIRRRAEAIAAVDKEIATMREIYTDINPKIIGKLEDRNALVKELEGFLKSKGVAGLNVDGIDQVEKSAGELAECGTRLAALGEKRRALEQEMADNEKNAGELTAMIPESERLAAHHADLERSVRALGEELSDIAYAQSTLRNDLRQIERARSEDARGSLDAAARPHAPR